MRKINYLASDKKSAISSYGDEFSLNEVVGHQDDSVGTATILSFTMNDERGEVRVDTDKGYAHLDFLVKLNP